MEETERLKISTGSVEIIRDEHGQGWVIIRRVCEILSLDPKSQQRKLRTHLGGTVTRKLRTIAEDGKLHKQACLSVESVRLWLCTLAKGRITGHKTEAYFIRSVRTGYIKVGTSANAKKRLLDLARQYPDRLELLAVGGVEEELHQSLAKHRVHGEWFNPHRDVLLAIHAVGGSLKKPIAVAGMKGIKSCQQRI